MRTGTPFIENASPVVNVSFYDIAGVQIGNTYTNNASDRRVIHVNKLEEPYTGKGKIHLDNTDGGLDALDFLGSRCKITWAWSGGTLSVDEPVWVVNQREFSSEGRVLVEITVLSAWELMEWSTGVNVADTTDMTTVGYGSTRIWDRDTTILDIIAEIIQGTGSFLEQWGLDAIIHLSDDGIIDAYQPLVFTRLNEDDRTIIRRLLQRTKSVMTIRDSTGPTINYINQTLAGPYYTYENDAVEHPFFINISGTAIPLPNYVIVVDQEPNVLKDEVANFVGTNAFSSTPLGVFGKIIVDPTVEDNAEADDVAEYYLHRVRAESHLGELYIPMNCCAELYDEIEIIDARTGKTFLGRIGSIERTFTAVANGIEDFNSQRDSYACRIKLGGIGGGSTRIESAAGGINDIETTINDFKGRSLVNPFIDTPQINQSALSQHLAPEINIDTCTANLTCDTVTPSGDIVGCARQFVANPFGPTVVIEIQANPFIFAVAGVAAGDTCAVQVWVSLNGGAYAQLGSNLPLRAAVNNEGKALSKTWLYQLAPGDTVDIKLMGSRVTGAGSWLIVGLVTDMITKVYAAKNLTVS